MFYIDENARQRHVAYARIQLQDCNSIKNEWI